MRLHCRQLHHRLLQGLGLGLALISASATGQNSLSKQPPPAISNLRLLARNSGYIFDGTVLSVEPVAQNESDSVATIQITFRVEQAIRGTRLGQVLTIREWAGLWNSGERYYPGERVLLFLYSPSKLGLTSPVGGPSGRFAVDSRGNALLENGRLPALALDPATQTQLGGKIRVNARALALAIQRADAE
jgi:hypothetical protein